MASSPRDGSLCNEAKRSQFSVFAILYFTQTMFSVLCFSVLTFTPPPPPLDPSAVLAGICCRDTEDVIIPTAIWAAIFLDSSTRLLLYGRGDAGKVPKGVS